MPKPKFPSIKDQGGLYVFLDLPEQTAKHNGYGSKEWKAWRAQGHNKSVLARLFNVNRQTIGKWIEAEG